MEKTFNFSTRGVCINSELVYYHQGEDLGFVKIEVCKCNGFWDFGFYVPGACSPCTNEGEFEDKEEAVLQAISLIKEVFEEDRVLGEADGLRMHFYTWIIQRDQPALF